MTEERRRSSDTLLQALFEQNADQHRENRTELREIREAVTTLATSRGEQGLRITGLENWRIRDVDPFIDTMKDHMAQVKGASKFAKTLYALGGLLGGGALMKIAATFLSGVAK